MTVPLIFLLMPAFLIIVLGPAIIGFMRSGNPMLGG
jgi:pilus assembly protein TadC